MASSQPLVPTGQPQGNRQETVAMMQQAGIPLAPPQPGGPGSPGGPGGPPVPGPAPGGPPPGGPAPAGQFNPLSLIADNGPEAFPFLSEPAVQPGPAEPDSTMAALAASAQSSFALAVLARLSQNQGGARRSS